jgi:hypothetical protein
MKNLKMYVLACAVAAGCLFGASACSGCNSSWWQNFTSNPLAVVQTFTQYAQTALSVAEGAWPAIYAALPAGAQPQALADYNKSVAATGDALTALNDGVQAAIDAETPNPDFSQLEQNVVSALTAIQQLITTLQQQGSAPQVAKGVVLPPSTSLTSLAANISLAKKIAHLQ